MKERLNGTISRYQCELIASAPGKAVVLYRLPSGASFLSLDLPANSLSFGYFWEDRPYNVYHWVGPDGSSLAWYYNIADRTTISAEAVTWRDLILDVLVVPGHAPRVLDREELPDDLPPSLRSAIEAAVAALLEVLPDLTDAIAATSARLLAEAASGADILE